MLYLGIIALSPLFLIIAPAGLITTEVSAIPSEFVVADFAKTKLSLSLFSFLYKSIVARQNRAHAGQ